MKRNNMYGLATFALVLILVLTGYFVTKALSPKKTETTTIEATVMKVTDDEFSIRDKNNAIYTFSKENLEFDVGEKIVIEYAGLLDKNKEKQDGKIINYSTIGVMSDENGIPEDYLDDGIFKNYYVLAYNKLKTLTTDEKIAQLLLVRYPDTNQKEILAKNQFAGYVFFEKDFKDKTEDAVKKEIESLQNVSKVPILTAVDEEGGSVVRVSSNTNLAKEKFKSPRELYLEGGMGRIREDTVTKSALLKNLGLNLNLAPVVDVSTDENDYMYSRTIGEGVDITSTYAKTVIEASKGTGVSYTLKHFPGYGNNEDTHKDVASDQRSYEDIEKNDLPPFKSGIDAGAEAILISHNTVNSIDSTNPASLSPSVHNVLRNKLGFTGISITDDIAMKALDPIERPSVKALLAGNDLVITTDYEKSIQEIKTALENGELNENIINKGAFRVIAWKYYKGLMVETLK